MLSIQGKCAVLVYKDYVTSRPTEVPEHDIYICESKYMEAEKAIRKLSKSMKVGTCALVCLCGEWVCPSDPPV